MIFKQSQIQDMLSILKKYELVFITGQLGTDYLSKYDKDILLAAGIDLDKYKNKKGIIEHAFLFGILAEAIGDDRAKKMSYNSFKKFLVSGNFIPLTEEEEFALQTVKQRAYTDITNLGNRMRNSLSNSVLRNNQQQSLLVQKVIKEKTVKAIEFRLGARGLAADLAETSKDWEVDWLRISYYLTQEAYNSGRAQSILKQYGSDAEVYFDVYIGACNRCKELYLIDPEDPDSEPKIFKLKDIIANGNNIGRKVADWKPTISPIHPYCRCTINNKKPGFAWDSELRAFIIPIKKISGNPKLNGVKLNIKISKSKNDDLFEKAHVNGEVHPNGKWVWNSSAVGGKGDWRVINKKNKSVENSESKGVKQFSKNNKNIKEYAKETSTEKLKLVVKNENAPEEIKNEAKNELKDRGEETVYLGNKTEELFNKLKNNKFVKMNRASQIKLISQSEIENLKTVAKLNQNFTDSEANSLDIYVSNEYKEINKILREGLKVPKKYEKILKDINNVFNKNKLEEDIIVFRGTEGIEEKDKAYKSTSINLYDAYNFSNTEKFTINAYKIPKGTSYAYIGGGEKELLLPPLFDLEKYKL